MFLNQRKRQTWRTFDDAIEALADFVQRGGSAQIGGDGKHGNQEENDKAGSLQLFVSCKEADKEQTKTDSKTDRWKVIQQKMNMGQIHNCFLVLTIRYL